MNKLLSLLLVLCVTVSFAQTKESALEDAKKAAMATKNKEAAVVLEYIHPKIVALMGSKEQAIAVINTGFAAMDKQGMSIEESDVVSVSEVVEEQGEFRCVVSTKLVMNMGEEKVINSSSLLGFYNKEAKHWVFIESSIVNNPAMMGQFIPGFKTSLEIPKDTRVMSKN